MVLEASWGLLEAYLKLLGRLGCLLEAVLSFLESVLGRLWAVLAPSWAPSWYPWNVSAAFLACLRNVLGHFGRVLERV